MKRTRAVEARQIIAEELERAGWETEPTFTVEAGARPGADSIDWWRDAKSIDEQPDTLRNLAYLRAYVRIAGEMPIYACGLMLDRGRLWMDRSIMSRLESKGYLAFEGAGKNEPWFVLTEKGQAFVRGEEGAVE